MQMQTLYKTFSRMIALGQASIFKRTTTPLLLNLKRYRSKNNKNKTPKEKKTMVDPKRVVSYEDMLKLLNHPRKVIIDVRDPHEIWATGKIPSSINIPLETVEPVLTYMSGEDFLRYYRRHKPVCSDELIFYCRSGRRSSEALDKALKLGYSNSKTYMGSWDEWSSKQKDKDMK